MSDENRQHENNEIIRPVPSRDSFVIFENSIDHQTSSSESNIASLPTQVSSVAGNNRDDSNLLQLQDPCMFTLNNNRDDSFHKYNNNRIKEIKIKPLQNSTKRVISQSFNSSFSKPSTFSRPEKSKYNSRSCFSDSNAPVYGKII